jgi:serine protease Do
MVDDLTQELVDQYKLKTDSGVVISKVVKGSAAEGVGLREGDVVLEVERTPVRTSKDFFEAVRHRPDEGKLLLRISREDRAFFVVLKPGDAPQDSDN